jgi:predicted dehydrogenase
MIRFGMVGGGPPKWIGEAHRKAASLTGILELVAGCFSSNYDKSLELNKKLQLDTSRIYKSFEEMADKESQMPADKRLDFIAVVTPDALHFPVSKLFIEKGFHVLSDKPMTSTLADAQQLYKLAKEHNVLFGVTYNYSGHAMVKEARELIKKGDLGEIKKVVLEYAQSGVHENRNSNISTLLGIGTHAYHLMNYITGLDVEELCADVTTFTKGRTVEDDINVLVKYKSDRVVKGAFVISQVSTGEVNGLWIRVYGTQASLEWKQEDPNYLKIFSREHPTKILQRGKEYLSEIAKYNSMVPAGHPEGYLEAFSNIYRNFSLSVAARTAGKEANPLDLDFPTTLDGLKGVLFRERVLQSSETRSWMSMDLESVI